MASSRNFRRVPLEPLAAGVRTDRHPARLLDGQSPNALNVEFGRESIASARGSRKLNNQILPRPALLCRPDPAYSPLYVEASKSVPLRGAAFWQYDSTLDLGGDGASAGTFPSETFHNRRGRSFELQVSVRLPETFRMYERPARGEGAPNPGNAAVDAGCGYDEGLDDCTIILQKGGDRTVPMSWALGIVNAGNHAYNAGFGSAPARKSNYFLVFMWLDSAGWSASDPTKMRYSMTDPSAAGASGLYSTQALRAFILDGHDDGQIAYALEPGRTYNVSLSLTLDTAPVSGSTWNNNGRVDFRCQEENGRLFSGSFVDSGGGGTTTNLSAWKGPSDSLRYLSKYGIRYSGLDAVHIGLGYRLCPWQAQGWIPYGHDSAAMEHKGFRMADCSSNSIDDLYGPGLYTLVSSHAGGADAFVTVNANRALTTGNANLAQSPLGTLGVVWQGYGGAVAGAPSTAFNADALRGYRFVVPRASVTGLQGACLNIQNYVEQSGVEFRLFLQDAASLALTWTSQPFLIRAFRWNQQPLAIQDVRIWSSSRDYTNPRVVWSMRNSLQLDDSTEPELEKLQGYLSMDDGGGRVLKERLRRKDAFLAPFGLGLSDLGGEKNSLFLSGEGEALVLDLAEDPVFAREMRAMLQSNKRGLAIELSCVLPEAYYGVARAVQRPGQVPEYDAAYCPDLLQIAVKNADEAGTAVAASPLLTMGHHSYWAQTTGTTPERSPQGFHVDYHPGLDSEAAGMATAVQGFTRSGAGASNWDHTAPWVGKRITLQVGIQPSPANRAGTGGKENEYRVYLAATPKGVLKFAAGENPLAEFAYYAERAIQKKDLPRLVVTIGGAWNPTLPRGYTEYSCRVIVEEVRVYGATASGELPATSGNVTNERRGKILGRNSLPQRTLELADILKPLGAGTSSARFVEGSSTVTAPGGTSFYTQLPEDTPDSVREQFLVPSADTYLAPALDGIDKQIQEFYFIQSVSADGATMTLATPYASPDSAAAGAEVMNLVGYTVFDRTEEDLARTPLSLGSGSPYKPGTTKTKDLVLSPRLFENRSPTAAQWKVRIASPFTQGGLATVLAQWTRGVVAPRRGPVARIQALDDAVFAAGRGAIFRVDDRWRENGPTSTLRASLAFRAKSIPGFEQRFPLALDSARFSSCSNVWPYWTTTISRGFIWVYDFWVYVEEYAELETLAWLGCEYSHLLLGPAANDNRRGIGMWFRLANGRPELVMESAGNFAGGSAPPIDGRYVASSADRVPLRQWTAVRFYVQNYVDGAVDAVKIPGIHLNGRRTRVSVNAIETALTDPLAWIRPANGGGLIGVAGDTRNVLYLGVARDAIRAQAKSQFTALAQLGGQELPPGRIVGPMHSLVGRMAGIVVWRAASAASEVAGFPDYDPYSFSYAGRLVRFRADLQEGIGERVADVGTDTQDGAAVGTGVVLSHPAIDLYNEFGDSAQVPSMVAVGQRMYAANGGRVAYVDEKRGGPAGIVPPSSAPTFELVRRPLWEPNFAPSGSTSGEQDPIAQAAVGAAQQIYHYSTHGNNWVEQRFHDELKWSKDDAPAPDLVDIFALKFYWKPIDVAGRISLWSARRSSDSGGIYLECVDGKAELGWYDTALKKKVAITTSARVFTAGHWHYVNVRKLFPQQDTSEGNWKNAFFANGRRRRATFTIGVAGWAVGDVVRNAGVTKRGLVTSVQAGQIEYVLFAADTDFTSSEAVNNGGAATGTITQTPFQTSGDALIVRRFPKASTFADTLPWDAKSGTHRTCVSFTSGLAKHANTTGVGAVTPKGILYSGTTGGVINVGTLASVASAIAPFTKDMIGMYWQFASTVATAPEKMYRIQAVAGSGLQITVVDEFGNNPNLTGITNRDGAVFSGVDMQKGVSFDLSNAPDQAPYAIEFMGTALQTDPANGFSRCQGEFASFAWFVDSCSVDALYSAVHLFETGSGLTDHSEIGTDVFAFDIFASGGRPGELRVDAGETFLCVDTQIYAGGTAASTQPNSGLEIAKDTEASTNADSCFWKSSLAEVDVSGRRIVQVVFYDADQDVRSNPGPRLVLEVTSEDLSNPSGLTRVTLTNLPISHQPGNVERWIYATEANGIIPFRHSIVPDNVSGSVSVELDDMQLDTTDPLQEDNGPPPNCSVLGLSQDSLFYGDVERAGVRQRDIVFYSKPYLPVQVSEENVVVLVSGSGDRVTAMAQARGKLLVWKRDAMFAITVRDGIAFVESLSENVGAPGPAAVTSLDQDVFWLSTDRALYYYPGAGGPIWLGRALSDVFEGSNLIPLNVDRQALERAVLGVNRRLDQVVCAFKALEDDDQRRRFSVEYDLALSGAGVPGDPGESWRYALYAGPNLTALEGSDREVGGPQRFLGGTAEGFVCELDRFDTQRELVDPTLPSTVTLTAGSTTTKLVLSAGDTRLIGLEGVRGLALFWLVGSTEFRATALFSDGSSIWLDRPVASAPPTGTVVSIGAIPLSWSSKVFDFGTPEEEKEFEYVDLVLVPQVSGTAVLEVFVDNGASAQQLVRNGVLASTATIDLTRSFFRQPLNEVRGKLIQFRLRTVTPAVGVELEVTSIVVRVIDGELH